MEKATLQEEARIRMRWMEKMLSDYHVTAEHRAYYLLLSAIYHASLPDHFEATGGVERIDEDTADEGKIDLFRRPLSSFERDVVQVINAEVDQLESRSNPSSLRTDHVITLS